MRIIQVWRVGISISPNSSKFEPPHDKTNKMASAPSEDSDQPGHPPSLIRVFAVRSMGRKGPKLYSYGQRRLIRLGGQWVAKDPSFLHTDSEDSDQTGRLVCILLTFLVNLSIISLRRLSIKMSIFNNKRRKVRKKRRKERKKNCNGFILKLSPIVRHMCFSIPTHF